MVLVKQLINKLSKHKLWAAQTVAKSPYWSQMENTCNYVSLCENYIEIFFYLVYLEKVSKNLETRKQNDEKN